MRFQDMDFKTFKRNLEDMGISNEDKEDLEFLVISISDIKTQCKVMEEILKDNALLNKLIDFIKRKRQFIGEYEESGWDKIIDEQKKIVKNLVSRIKK